MLEPLCITIYLYMYTLQENKNYKQKYNEKRKENIRRNNNKKKRPPTSHYVLVVCTLSFSTYGLGYNTKCVYKVRKEGHRWCVWYAKMAQKENEQTIKTKEPSFSHIYI